MIRRAMFCISVALLLTICLPLGARAQGMATEGYVDEFVVHVKQNCPQYETLVKKLVAGNHANGGDNWIALASTYGEGNIYRFVATRASYGDIEAAQGKFMGALTKSMGEAGTMKLFADLSACSDSTQGVLRARRWDLSIGKPADAAAYAKVIAGTRWIRLITVHVKPGMSSQFEATLKMVNAAMLKADQNASSWISQSVAGDAGTVYYISQLKHSLADFDSMKSMRAALGEEGYSAYQGSVAQAVTRTDIAIYQMQPTMSNPPDEVVAADPGYWHPKPAAPPKAAAVKTPPAKKN